MSKTHQTQELKDGPDTSPLTPLPETVSKSFFRTIFRKKSAEIRQSEEPIQDQVAESPDAPQEQMRRFKKPLRYRHMVLLLLFWISMTAVFGIVLILSLLKTSKASNVARYTIEPSLYSALNNFALAQEAAKSWQSDVQFVSAAAKWEQPSVDDLTAPIEWFYRFYSQEQQRYLFVIVTPDQAVIARPHISRTLRESRVINAELWAVDSPEALTTWLNEGNGWLWLNQSSNVVVSAQLGLDPEIDEPVWVVSATNPDSGQSATQAISALAKPEVSSNPFERLAGSILSSLSSEP